MLLAVMQTIHDSFADSKYRPCPLLKEMVAAGCLGRKSGGAYRY
jgi:3-hydroxybutyryl-CoA dehydrogenase